MTDKIAVLMTCKNAREAGKIARHLLDKHLIACASLIPQISSIYRWEGKVVSEKECYAVLKTSRELLPTLLIEVDKEHSYSLPEMIALPIIDGSANYLNWIAEELTNGKEPQKSATSAGKPQTIAPSRRA
jgi:periplasmic divalent cation tolerance protein